MLSRVALCATRSAALQRPSASSAATTAGLQLQRFGAIRFRPVTLPTAMRMAPSNRRLFSTHAPDRSAPIDLEARLQRLEQNLQIVQQTAQQTAQRVDEMQPDRLSQPRQQRSLTKPELCQQQDDFEEERMRAKKAIYSTKTLCAAVAFWWVLDVVFGVRIW